MISSDPLQGGIMRKSICVMSLLLSLNLSANVRESTCQLPVNESHVMQGDFHWNMELAEIVQKEAEIRASGKRLKGRAYLNEAGELVLPMKIFNRGEVEVAINSNFISSITKQVEKAFERGYINALIFPDMGHSHLFIPKSFYESELAGLGPSRFDELYQKVFANPETKILYHTAEQLKLVGDDKLPLRDRLIQWRFYTRNILGGLKNDGAIDLLHEMSSSHNTAHNYKNEEYRYWGAGFNISTSKDGCFSYKVGSETFYYDISLEDLPY